MVSARRLLPLEVVCNLLAQISTPYRLELHSAGFKLGDRFGSKTELNMKLFQTSVTK